MIYKDPGDEHYHEVTGTGDRYQEIKVDRAFIEHKVTQSITEDLIFAMRLARWRDKPAAIGRALRWVWTGKL